MRFFEWVNERHSIWRRRDAGEEVWTEDPIMLEWAFTNVFRQLDRGTVALRDLLKICPPDRVTWTVTWYRLFNRDTHARRWLDRGVAPTADKLIAHMDQLYNDSVPIFPNAHQSLLGTRWSSGAGAAAIEQCWQRRAELDDAVLTNSMHQVFEAAKSLPMVGAFTAYEIANDLRHVLMTNSVVDARLWANVGPGSAQGLRRLGLPPSLLSMQMLLARASTELDDNVRPHLGGAWPPFELAEIEHSLCEYHKYERCRTGGARLRRRFRRGES